MSVQKAIEQSGGVGPLSRRIGVTYQAVQQWAKAGRIPVERVLEVERLTGISRHELRPDIYGTAPTAEPQGAGS